MVLNRVLMETFGMPDVEATLADYRRRMGEHLELSPPGHLSVAG